jgi:NAD(P)-dependent dehydrogenase (short-subunit alcohol dehydrogenase family)
MFELTDRCALITGAASGLGRAFAIAFAAHGANVLCVDLDEDVHKTVSAITQTGGKATASVSDVADEMSVSELAQKVAHTFGVLHILVNNAGIATPPNRLLEVDVRDWDRVIAVNLRSVFLCSKAMLPMLLLSKDASVVNLSSFLGLKGLYPGFPVTAIPYAASKAAIDGFTRQFAIEYAREGIRVNGIAPGWHGGTRLGRERRVSATPDDLARFESFLSSSIPMGHRGTPEDLTGLAIYLASSASSYVTGQIFAHDGGLTAA